VRDVHVSHGVELSARAGHVVGVRLRVEDGVDLEADAVGVHRGRQHVVGADATRGDNRAAATLRHGKEELELAHLVAAVDARRRLLALHPQARIRLFHGRR
jgi:hypothetical protein